MAKPENEHLYCCIWYWGLVHVKEYNVEITVLVYACTILKVIKYHKTLKL